MVDIYTDGACSPNPGIGGWGAVLLSPKHDARREIQGAEEATTNNRMEILAAIRALQALKRPCRVRLFTDSQYLREAFASGWLDRWKRNGWRTSGRKPVANDDLWRDLDQLAGMHEIEWIWIRGHADNPENERADALAVQARETLRETLRERM